MADAPIDERTEHLDIELPSNIEHLEFDYYRLRNAIVAIDLLIHNLSTLLGQEVEVLDEGIAGILDALSELQPALVSGVNLKTVNGQSLLAAGNLDVSLVPLDVAGTSGAVAKGEHARLLNAAATTLTAPAAAGTGDRWRVSVCNRRTDNLVDWNGLRHEGSTVSSSRLDHAHGSWEFEYINPTFGWKWIT